MEKEITQNPGDRIKLGEDGKYRWVYEMSLFKNPTVFWLVWKIFFCIFLGIFAVVLISDAHLGTAAFLNNLKVLGYVLLGMTALVGLGYLLYAAAMGGKYIVEFEMDENGVSHKQIEAQAKKAKKLGRATMLGGSATGSMTTVGVGMNAQRTEMYSEFAKVRKVKAYPCRNLIKICGRISHNQVYAAAEDFEFVKDFIISRCANVKSADK